MVTRAPAPLAAHLLGLAACAALAGCGPTRSGATLTTIEDVRRLDREEAQRGRLVRLQGTVTLHDPLTHRLVLQDPTGGIWVDVANLAAPSYAGATIALQGITSAGDLAPVIIDPRVERLEPGRAPAPRPVGLQEMGAGAGGRRVEARGTVRAAKVQHDGALALDVATDGGAFTAVFYDSRGMVFSSLVDAVVRIRGVASATVGVRGEVLRPRLLAATGQDLTIEDPAPVEPFATPARSMAELRELPATGLPRRRVRVRGTVVSEDPAEGILLRDGTDTLSVHPAHLIPLRPGQEIEALGFAVRDERGLRLQEATLRPLVTASAPAPEDAAPRKIGRALDVRTLSPDEARQGLPVRLHAVVTYYDAAWSLLFVEDETGGIFVDLNGQPELDLRAGDRVLVTGATDPGNFAPQVANPRVRVLGPGPLPAERAVAPEELFTGRFDSQWVTVEGVVQATRQEPGRLWLDLAAGLYRFGVLVPVAAKGGEAEALVDARVRVRGASATVFNEKRQLVGVQVNAQALDFVSVVERRTADAFSLPPRPVASLLQFGALDPGGHRVRVEGVATLRGPDGVFIQDHSGGLLVQGPGDGLAVGDRLEAVGFPVVGGYTPVLRDAVLRRLKTGPPPGPLAVTGADAATGNYDAQLVQIDAYLLDRSGNSREQVLTLQAGGAVFQAVFQGRPDPRLAALRPGSLLELTGVCTVEAKAAGGTLLPASFDILLRSPEDVVVLEGAPWWTMRHTLTAGLAMTLAALAALLWVVLLRKRVRAQTEVIRRGHGELLTAEKMASLGRLTAGIAHEMNTPIATVRAALFELRRLADEYSSSIGDGSVTPADHHEIAAEMAKAVLLADKGAERAAGFVRGIKSQTRDTGPEEGARFDAAPVVEEALLLLGHAAREKNCTLEFDRGRDVIEIHGVPGRLGQVVTNLLTNALDASAIVGGGPVWVELARNGTAVHLRVRDGGAGIAPETLPRIFDPMFTTKPFGEGTGLGLSIVHDIVTGHFGGRVSVESEPGRGTTFDVALPPAGAKVSAPERPGVTR